MVFEEMRRGGNAMAAPIIMHNAFEDTYDDADHPIPAVETLDINLVKKTGGSDLIIIIASPLKADERSQRRLLRKIELYLMFIATPEFERESGVANPETTSIIVRIHPGSDAVIFDLLERCKPWGAGKQRRLQDKPARSPRRPAALV